MSEPSPGLKQRIKLEKELNVPYRESTIIGVNVTNSADLITEEDTVNYLSVTSKQTHNRVYQD